MARYALNLPSQLKNHAEQIAAHQWRRACPGQRLPGRAGLEMLRHWREVGNPLPVLILTARDAWHE